MRWVFACTKLLRNQQYSLRTLSTRLRIAAIHRITSSNATSLTIDVTPLGKLRRGHENIHRNSQSLISIIARMFVLLYHLLHTMNASFFKNNLKSRVSLSMMYNIGYRERWMSMQAILAHLSMVPKWFSSVLVIFIINLIFMMTVFLI